MSAVEAEFLKAQQARLGLLEEKKTARRRLDMEQQQEQQQQHQPSHVKQGHHATHSGTNSAGDNTNMGKHNNKFIFKRYRQAIALRLEQQGVDGTQQQDEKCRLDVGEVDKKELSSHEHDDDLTLQGYENVIIHIRDAHVEILSNTKTTVSPNATTAASTTTILPHAHHHPPTVLRNLRHCHVYFHLGTTTILHKSSSSCTFCWKTTTLHFVNLHDSTITFALDSTGSHQNSDHHPPSSSSSIATSQNNIASIHATNCHTCTFSSSNDDDVNSRRRHNDAKDGSSTTTRARRWLSCQQLRLHQSSQLDFCLDVTAGAILEDCTRIVFYQQQQQKQDDDNNDNSGNQHFLSVQDFGWLRPGIPSPNYQILVAAMPPPPKLVVGPCQAAEQQQQKVQEEPNNVNNAENASDDSDDEL